MAGRDLRALFSSNDRGVSTTEAFTNRQAQWDLVAAALAEHLQHVAAPGFDVEDLEAPRDNVLVFHGVGGIGKTTLSRKVEAALGSAEHRPAQWGEPSWPSSARIRPVRIDLSRSAGGDFEHLVLTIRAALADLGRPLPAFDVALRRYWEHQHPGEPLEEYLQRGGLAARFGKAMPQQMQSALSDVAQALLLPGTVGSAVGQVTGSLVRALRERRQTVRALAGCFRLGDLLEAEPDLETLSFYPHLLAWELARLPADKRVTPVILLDTFEDIGDRTHRDLERLIQRVVWLMPNCFFVITGRSRLQWAEPALQGQLDYTGPNAWPGLAASSRAGGIPHARGLIPGDVPVRGRQVLIGDFAPEDCDDYLARRLETDGTPLIPEPVRNVITRRSHGLPLYLDLSVMRFLELRRTGRTPEPADFEHDFGALIARTLADLTPDERHVLRSVSLLDAFDEDLATQTAGLPHRAAARRLIERPFVHENPFGLWPHHLHGLIRSTIRSADDLTDDRWTPTDWERAAVRAHAALGEQWTAGADRDRLLLVGCLRQGLALARDFRLDLGWLTDAAWAYVSDSVWEPVAPAQRADRDDAIGAGTGPETAADALVELLSTLARRQHEHRARTADRLAALTTAELLPDELQEMAVYYLAKATRDLGRSEDSRRGMQYVADRDGRLAPAARRGLAHLARLAGDFPTAHAMVPTLGWAGRHHRVDGDIWWPHGDMYRAAAAYSAARGEAEQHGVAGERATSQAQRAFALAFTDPAVADDELELAEQLLTGLDLRATTLTVKMAALVRDAGTDRDVLGRAEVLRAEIRTAGLLAPEAILELAVAFHHAVRDDRTEFEAVVERLEQLTGDYAYYADIAGFMANRNTPLTSARWIEDEETVRRRWQQLVTARARGPR
ncbi:ATP/GTP-binding protein [Streptomyces sp. WAC01280]|uniref:ATP/GTP-binding protein n=1 Tax=Streptomyces sp. WAC01280 TaxID=2487424 RepID=UPI000F78D3F3|nr:ATP/GTP-binding protein [Streptomyces sp. WAC01280]RSS57485.1 ATP/GTP-binding protein [Streptomyces sp. WAC01280]